MVALHLTRYRDTGRHCDEDSDMVGEKGHDG